MAAKWTLLAHLDDPGLARVLSHTRRRRFARGEVVFHEGDPGDTLHLVDKGHFAVRITTSLGEVATIRVHGPGGFFGELAVIDPAPRSATVVALTKGETLSLSGGALADLRKEAPAIDRVLVDGLAAEVRRLSGALVEALYAPADKRVMARLAELAGTFGGDGSEPVTVPLTQEELAQLAGTTRPTVNRLLGSLEEAGVVAVARGRIEVTDRVGLERRARI